MIDAQPVTRAAVALAPPDWAIKFLEDCARDHRVTTFTSEGFVRGKT